MKRDMDLVLRILEYFETRNEVSVVENLEIDNYDKQFIKYHLRLMYQANLIVAEEETSSSTKKRLIDVYPFELTWEGHEFLTSIRDKNVLKKVRERLGKSFSDIPFTILKEVALAIFRSEVGI